MDGEGTRKAPGGGEGGGTGVDGEVVAAADTEDVLCAAAAGVEIPPPEGAAGAEYVHWWGIGDPADERESRGGAVGT